MHRPTPMLSSDAADRRIPSATQLILLGAIVSNPQSAYGTALTKQMEAIARRSMSDAQVYVMLQRLEDRGLIESATYPAPSAKGRGRPRRYYSVTKAGRRVLEDAGSLASVISSLSSPRRGESNEEKAPNFTPVVV